MPDQTLKSPVKLLTRTRIIKWCLKHWHVVDGKERHCRGPRYTLQVVTETLRDCREDTGHWRQGRVTTSTAQGRMLASHLLVTHSTHLAQQEAVSSYTASLLIQFVPKRFPLSGATGNQGDTSEQTPWLIPNTSYNLLWLMALPD